MGAATYVAAQVVPCQWAVLQGLVSGACGTLAWPFAAYPWLATGLLGVLTVGWAAVIGIAIIRQVARTHRRLPGVLDHAGEPSERLAAAAVRAGPFPVVEVDADGQPLAFCHGLLRPRLVFSTALVGMLDEAELEAVVHHEAAHARARDPLRIVVMRAVAWAAWPLPALRDLARHAAVANELAADRHAVDRLGEPPVLSALSTLLSCPRLTLGVEGVARIDAEAARVAHLTRGTMPRPRPRTWTMAVSAAVLLLLVGLTVPAVMADRATSTVYSVEVED